MSLESLLELQMTLFLELGGLIALPSRPGFAEDLWVGWGDVFRSEEGPQGLGARGGWFYAPDFFLHDKKPWWTFSNGLRISRQLFLEILERELARIGSNGPEVTTGSPLISAQEVDPRVFSEVFSDLKCRISKGPLTKGVPYVFQSVSVSSGPIQRLKFLIHLLRNTQGTPLRVYGVWDSEEGVLGATPEILFSQNGDRIETVALAGTRVNSGVIGGDYASLFQDPKEQIEHQIVVSGILDSLRSSVAEEIKDLQVLDTYELHLPTLTHLCTPILGRVEPASFSSNFFDRLVRCLHPTPALGAFPRSAGLNWLEELQEITPRGRFGAPFGLILPGEGESRSLGHCLVAIRNLQWDAQGVRIGAGCGVVGASQLDREWQEIQGKLRAVKNLFGIDVTPLVTPLGPNLKLAQAVLEEIYQLGVREVCVCPGARNAPWVALLSENSQRFKTYYHFEERSAAFFALGRIRQTGRPMAVITTSGTAAGELLPATMEAYYSGLPLILMTADRPRRYRKSGAPQTAEQVGIFGIYAPHSFDLEAGELALASESFPERTRGGLGSLQSGVLTQPVHINACFDEPLIDTEGSGQVQPPHEQILVEQNLTGLKQFFSAVKFPLVVVGMLKPEERESVVHGLLRLNSPVYLEATSGLREDRRLQGLRLRSAEGLLARIQSAGAPLDGVIRIGGIPTLRIWRDLESALQHLEVLSLSSLPFSGLGRKSRLWVSPLETSIEALFTHLEKLNWQSDPQKFTKLLNLDREATEHLSGILEAEPTSQLAWMARLSRLIPMGSLVYLGNSMPIRDWDLVATSEDRGFKVWASRGLNGIDGQVSTFLGYSSPESENWAILGDLTTLYDLAGPWVLSQLQNIQVNLVVINNGGGKIFSGMFRQKEFQNEHEVEFRAWAELWGLDYELWKEVPADGGEELPRAARKRSRIIEIQPSIDFTRGPEYVKASPNPKS